MSDSNNNHDREMVDKYANSGANDSASELRDAYAGNTGDAYGSSSDKYAGSSGGSLRPPPPPSGGSGSSFLGGLFGAS